MKTAPAPSPENQDQPCKKARSSVPEPVCPPSWCRNQQPLEEPTAAAAPAAELRPPAAAKAQAAPLTPAGFKVVPARFEVRVRAPEPGPPAPKSDYKGGHKQSPSQEVRAKMQKLQSECNSKMEVMKVECAKKIELVTQQAAADRELVTQQAAADVKAAKEGKNKVVIVARERLEAADRVKRLVTERAQAQVDLAKKEIAELQEQSVRDQASIKQLMQDKERLELQAQSYATSYSELHRKLAQDWQLILPNFDLLFIHITSIVK